jgi:hypothetical protein
MEFIEYVKSFYSQNGIYPLFKNGEALKDSDIHKAVILFHCGLGKDEASPFASDSFDREQVRGILEKHYNYAEQV